MAESGVGGAHAWGLSLGKSTKERPVDHPKLSPRSDHADDGPSSARVSPRGRSSYTPRLATVEGCSERAIGASTSSVPSSGSPSKAKLMAIRSAALAHGAAQPTTHELWQRRFGAPGA